ncbi:MAG TPA: hypothetical protein VFN76_10160 [Candidatus Limnocylindria bacterium]|nr:hypothetical protein [Candidatus Limnocylindria bacterium]
MSETLRYPEDYYEPDEADPPPLPEPEEGDPGHYGVTDYEDESVASEGHAMIAVTQSPGAQPGQRGAAFVRDEIARRRRLFDRPVGYPESPSWLDAWAVLAQALGGVVVAVFDDRGVSTYVFRRDDHATVISDLEAELEQIERAEDRARRAAEAAEAPAFLATPDGPVPLWTDEDMQWAEEQVLEDYYAALDRQDAERAQSASEQEAA